MTEKNPAYYFNNVVTALVMLLIYMLLASYFLPSGINSTFTFQAINLILALLVLSFLTFILLVFLTNEKPLVYLTKDKSLFSLKRIERFEFQNLIFLLFPMTPIVQYVILNNEILSISNYFIIISFFLIFILVFAYLIPWILSILASKEILTLTSLGFLFVIFNMASLTASNNWHHQGSLLIQSFVLIIIIALILALNFISKKIFTAAVVIFFTINIAASAAGLQTVEWSTQKNEGIEKFLVESILKGKEIKNNNDVLFIVYESYSNYETMKYYGFDNSAQLNLLEQNGFHIYHGVYSLGTPTIESISMLFNIEREPLHRVFLSGGGATHRILSKKGYNTIGVFQNDYHFRGLSIDEITYDFPFPEPAPREGANLLIHAILAGEFSDEVSLKGVGYESYLEQKLKVLNREYPSPTFMYSHSLYPGHRSEISLRPNEDKYIDIYLNRLTKAANIEMLKDIDKVIKLNPNAITIIAGDHGPFLTKTGYGLHLNPNTCNAFDIDRYDMQDRYGAFLAIRWPDENYATKHDIKILQDIFPAIFAYLFDDDSIFNKTRIKKRTTVSPQNICGVSIKEGIIVDGKDDGKLLFEGIQ